MDNAGNHTPPCVRTNMLTIRSFYIGSDRFSPLPRGRLPRPAIIQQDFFKKCNEKTFTFFPECDKL